MKILKTFIVLPFVSLNLILTSCSSSDDPVADNNAPSIFSANTVESGFDSATIEWTESIDSDNDPVTYAIIFEGQEVASGITNLTFSFFNLESETSYTGYVEARDGRGGNNRANFFFTTDPEVFIAAVEIQEFTYASTNPGCTTTIEISAGVLVPKYEGNNVSYSVTFGVLLLNGGNSSIPVMTRTWTNATLDPYYIYDFDAEHYFVWQAGAGLCSTNPNIDMTRAFYANPDGQATIEISRN